MDNGVERKLDKLIEKKIKKKKKEFINSDLEKSKKILRENWHLLPEDTKELLRLVGVEGKEK